MTWVGVALFGALGSISRLALSRFLNATTGMAWPLGTLVCNVVGSFVLGVLAGLQLGQLLVALGLPAERSLALELALAAGLLGGFTTYSTFNLEVLRFVQQHSYLHAAAYLVGTVGTCLAFGALGLAAGRVLRSFI